MDNDKWIFSRELYMTALTKGERRALSTSLSPLLDGRFPDRSRLKSAALRKIVA